MEQIRAPEEHLLGALVEGLEAHLAHALGPEIVVQRYEFSYCLRQMHVLAGPIRGRLLVGRRLLIGSGNAEIERALVGKLMALVARGAARL